MSELRTAPRYTSRVMLRARELREAGWSTNAIPDILKSELGVRPGKHSIVRWCNEEYAERRRRHQRGRPPEWQFARLTELRRNGLSFQALATVSTVLFDQAATAEMMRYRLRKAGVE